MSLAQGYTEEESAEYANVSRRTICRWKTDPEFSAEVDRLSLMVGIAARAERLRIVQQIVRQKTREDGRLRTGRDLLEWLKFAQSETDGIKLDLAAILEAATSVAGEGPGRTDSPGNAADSADDMAA